MDVLDIQTELDEERKLAIQLSQNAINGKDDPNILAQLYTSMNSLKWKQYSGVTDDAFKYTDEKLASLGITLPKYAELAIVFLAEEKAAFLELAAHILKQSVEKLELAAGEVRVVGKPDSTISLGDLARVLRGAPGYAFPDGLEPGLEASFHFRTDALAYANACHVAEVEVDTDTGGVKILRYLAIQDCGRLINPLIVEGQVVGGIVHGIGNALFEWMGYDDEAQPVTTTLAEYLLPTATELPMFETFYRESPSPLNPLGAKGAGEVGTIPVVLSYLTQLPNSVTQLRQPDADPRLRRCGSDCGRAVRLRQFIRAVLARGFCFRRSLRCVA